MRRLLIVCIKAYQRVISPWLGDCCRFYPSCSEYAIQALTEYGFIKGLWLAIVRLCKCHPFYPGGIDPIPLRKNHDAAPMTGGKERHYS